MLSSRKSWCAFAERQTRRWFAGHSKWSNIQHKKAANDKKRAKIFTKITKEIEHAARSGGGDVPENLLLQSARAKANQFNMPKDKIELAIQRAESNKDKGSGAEIVTYEATGPKGVALVIEALTDSRNRTAKELRHIVTRHNGSLDSKVLWNFERYGDIRVPKELPGGRCVTTACSFATTQPAGFHVCACRLQQRNQSILRASNVFLTFFRGRSCSLPTNTLPDCRALF